MNKRLYFVFGSYLALTLILLELSDWSIKTTIEKGKIVSLSSQAKSDITAEQIEYQNLKTEVSILTDEVSALKELRYPTLQDLKEMASQYRLKLRQIERGSRSVTENQKGSKYQASFVGAITSQVLFLKELEIRYLVETNGIVIKPADEKGEKVSMTISMSISE